MDFGRARNIENLDLSLPSNHPVNEKLLQKVSARTATKVFVGCPVWDEKAWVGKVYPPGTPAKDFLKHYSHQFNTIELNSTHYRIPDCNVISAWKEVTAPDFRFCPKIPRVISHDMSLMNAQDLTRHFCEAVAGLGDRLGMLFLQLPPYFGPNRLPVLQEYLRLFPEGFGLAVELRHEGWFNDTNVADQIFGIFEEYGITPVITDVAARRDVLHMRLATSKAFIRFTANDLHPTDFPRMDAWAARVREWLEMGLEEVYFFAHTPDHALYPDVANYMIRQLNEACRLNLRECRFYGGQQQYLF